jgi:hypothetical protein
MLSFVSPARNLPVRRAKRKRRADGFIPTRFIDQTICKFCFSSAFPNSQRLFANEQKASLKLKIKVR